MAVKNWIAGAIKRPGDLTRKAKSAGKSVEGFCDSPKHDTHTKRQCALAKTLKSFSKK